VGTNQEPNAPEPETLARTLTCAKCGRSQRAGEVWRIYFADRVAREAVTYCPECAERELGVSELTSCLTSDPFRRPSACPTRSHSISR
jgi:hypothetical protein